MKLPIDDVLPELLDVLRRHSCAVLKAPTGAGKTTRVPPAIDAAGLLSGDEATIVMLEPRRIAARAAARWMARGYGQQVGRRVGYQVRLDRRVSSATTIKVVTEGILVRMLQSDPFLSGVGAVIFDEFHERSLAADMALAMTRKVQREVREDLKVVVMSATLDVGPVSDYLGGAPVVESEGRLYPVRVDYLLEGAAGRLEERVRRGVEQALVEAEGDVLVFLPGVGDIRRSQSALSGMARREGIDLVPLHGGLRGAEQDAALKAGPRRKVILSTNVAETSVTVEGIGAVVDSGLVKTMTHNPDTGLDRLEVRQVSLASAEQRAGRAGRERPGYALRLWTENRHRTLEPREPPEVLRVDMAGPSLELMSWGEPDVRAFEWFEPPTEEAVDQATELLTMLGAVDARGVTPTGQALARMPTHPRLGKMIAEGHRLGHLEVVCQAAALLSDRDPFWSGSAPAPRSRAQSDVMGSVEALGGRGRRSADRGHVAFIRRVAGQLERVADDAIAEPSPPRPQCGAEEAVARGLLAAYPDRVALRRRKGDNVGLMVGGRGVELYRSSHVKSARLFVCVDIDGARRRHASEALVRRASAVEEGWLDAEHITEVVEVEWDEDTRKVYAMRRRYYMDLVLDEQNAAIEDPDAASALLAERAAEDLEAALPLTEGKAASFLTRLRFVATHMPELELPTYDEDDLRALLPALCAGRRSFEELRRAPLLDYVKGALSWEQQQAVARHAPERVKVPSGSSIRLQWEGTRPPVLAVRIQEIFGLEQTPTVCGGRVPMTLHLLAPNFRPQQITQDLPGFWDRTYHEVRKELRQRYPKHPWPEDPRRAKAVYK